MIHYQLKTKHAGPATFDLSLSMSRIVFLGTPEFAAASLDALVKAGFNIVAVITAPDKPAGRGMKLNESAVKKYAVGKGLKILQPEKLKNPEFLAELKSLNADIQDRGCFSHAAGRSLEHASEGNRKSSCFAFAAISRSSSH